MGKLRGATCCFAAAAAATFMLAACGSNSNESWNYESWKATANAEPSEGGEITLGSPANEPSYDCGPTGSFTSREVPNFCGRPYDAAYAFVADHADIAMSLDMNSNGAGKDDYNIVCSQSPKAGATIKPGMKLVLDVGNC